MFAFHRSSPESGDNMLKNMLFFYKMLKFCTLASLVVFFQHFKGHFRHFYIYLPQKLTISLNCVFLKISQILRASVPCWYLCKFLKSFLSFLILIFSRNVRLPKMVYFFKMLKCCSLAELINEIRCVLKNRIPS